ncbi:RNA polymerase sigma factor [Bacteroidia bacterium]|nr:RNA polymerase sigma factor [Bacteroidia bacterium]
MTKVTDEHILGLISKGGADLEHGYRLMMECYQQRLYWHIRRIVVAHEDAEDVLQDSLVNIYRGLSRFRGQSSLYTWMFRIATNESLRFLRDRHGENTPFEQVREKLIGTLWQETGPDSEEILVRFQQALLHLPNRQRVVFTLRYYEEMPYEEMARVLDSTVENMKTNYHYASKKIKELMTK